MLDESITKIDQMPMRTRSTVICQKIMAYKEIFREHIANQMPMAVKNLYFS